MPAGMRHLAAIATLPLLAACATVPAAHPQERFWQALSSHCGKAYAGALASEDARDADWRGKRMVAHWAACSDERIDIAFHVEDPAVQGGWNRSRTWVVTRGAIAVGTGPGTRFVTLKHDHRHADGEADAVTWYGGTTGASGSARAQDFPVDRHSAAVFEAQDLAASITNVWRIEVDPAGTPDARFVYQLTRRNDATRLFRVAFDATRPVTPPPPAWGHE